MKPLTHSFSLKKETSPTLKLSSQSLVNAVVSSSTFLAVAPLVLRLSCRHSTHFSAMSSRLLFSHQSLALNIALVLDVGLKHCRPCVKVYPTVLKLSRQMDNLVFIRMNGDENDSCIQFLRDMNVVEVPTFLFIRDGEICGRYVGCGKGELIREILRYQGVCVTY